MTLRRGDRGPDVEQLQLKLKAASYDPGDVDGHYGQRTAEAVLAFQADRPSLDDDGVAGPMTLSALDAAIARKAPTARRRGATTAPVPCEDDTWAAFQRLVAAITTHPVRYGPGRGLWHRDKFVVTCGAGRLDAKSWPNVLGRPYASFHCSSWTNFVLGWLLRRNEQYTHGGNVPSLFDLLEKGPELQISGGGAYRGYGDAVSPIASDGSSTVRSGISNALDARELLARRAELPTFVICGQSTRRTSGWLWWHHTVLFVVDHRDGDRLYRIAADGHRGSRGYSAEPMRWVEVTDKNIGNLGAAVYRAYGVDTADGTYGDQRRPIAGVSFEEA